MRAALLTALLVFAAVLAVGCGGTSSERPAAAPDVRKAEPAVADFAGKPLAMVFFHPL